jgi:3-oxoacyl-[acyl-carrier protein] reductase
MKIDLTGRVALVTGSTRGIGRSIAETLAECGARVAVVGRDAAKAQEVASQVSLDAKGFACDVADIASVTALVAAVEEAFGSVDVLVNNAGTLDHLGQLPDQAPELWERDLRVNLTGAFNCAQAVWPHMQERGWGRIVNMASVAGTLGGFGQASYSTTKAGLLGLTRTLALEGARHGITCNAIVPGIIGTEAFNFGNPEMNERMVRRTAMRRAGEPQDVANAIVFLCSDLASYITGVALNVSGGIELFTF